MGEVRAVVHHRQQDAVDLELGVQLPLDLVDGGQQLLQPLAGRYSAWTGTMMRLAAARALTVSIPREG